jgi:hypothetical protein
VNTSKPLPSSIIEDGSGITVLAIPLMSVPAVVPNEKVAEVMVVLEETFEASITQVASSLRNGLCEVLVMELLAFE